MKSSIVFLILLSGCASMERAQDQTSGIIGCPKDEITIIGLEGIQHKTWKASCRGKNFFCSQHDVWPRAEVVNCKEEMIGAMK